MRAAEDWGPWEVAITCCERIARLRSLAILTHAFFGKGHPLIDSLFWAESQEPEDLAAAEDELSKVPAKDRRKILSTYATHLAERAQASARRSVRERS